MIKIYSMSSCPDCTGLEEQVKGNKQYEIIDIGLHVKNLKDFLQLRDTHTVFREAKKVGAIGIPCFVLKDGTVTLTPQEAGLKNYPSANASTCNRDGSGC